MMPPVRWKPIHGFPLYEISEEGQVRIIHDCPLSSGLIKRRYRRVYQGVAGKRQVKTVSYPKSIHMRGTLMVDMTKSELSAIGKRLDDIHVTHNRKHGSPRYTRSIAKLMDKHWPGVEYPKDWVSDKSVLFDPRVRRGRKTVPDHQLLEIMDDNRTSTEVWHASDLGKSRSWVDQVHRGAGSLARRLKEYGRDALYEDEAVYWWDSEERGHRIKKLISGDLPDYSHYQERKGRENYADKAKSP